MRWWEHLMLWSVVSVCFVAIGYCLKIEGDLQNCISQYEKRLEAYHDEYHREFSSVEEKLDVATKTCNDAVIHCDYVVDKILSKEW